MTQDEQQAVENILAPYKKDYTFYYFVEGNMPREILSKLKYEFGESMKLPFIVNLSLRNSMDEYFYNLIQEDLVIVE